MTDRFKEQARELVLHIMAPHGHRISPYDVDAIATALSDAYEAGRREEREECAEVADNEKAVWDGDLSIMAFSARKAAEDIAAAIRSREAVE